MLGKFLSLGPLIGVLGFAGFLLWGAFNFVGEVMNIPDVSKNYLTRECVAVEYPDGSQGSCDQLPGKYHVVWVE